MLSGWQVHGAVAFPSKTATAGTVITQVIPPRLGLYTNLSGFVYTAGATAHTMTVMRPFNWTTFTAAAAASQAVVNITADPGLYATAGNLKDNPGSFTPSVADNGIAANDFVVYELPDGNLVVDTVSSVSSLAITLTTNLPTGGVSKGARIWFFGIITNTNPHTGVAHATWALADSATTTHEPTGGNPLLRSTHQNHPMILHSGNATNAGTLNRCAAFYTKN
jgi:hypothetical protein